MPIKFWINLAVGVVALAAVYFAVTTVLGWKEDSESLPKVQDELAQTIADRDAYLESARRAAEVAGKAEARVDELLTKMDRPVRVVYQEAKREDPDCAAWAAAPIMCPLDGMRRLREAEADSGTSVP